jgi:hypothetical protein
MGLIWIYSDLKSARLRLVTSLKEALLLSDFMQVLMSLSPNLYRGSVIGGFAPGL